jgi:hypothetical protein
LDERLVHCTEHYKVASVFAQCCLECAGF